ncbi:hypothetical protein SESBI_36374 [Sesbania bispinosa]|nr:hypothetical protein SESBI_36374 [Sesbania bispinosa]
MDSKKAPFVPQMNAKSLKAFSRVGKCKPSTTDPSQKVITFDNEVSSTTISDKLPMKKAAFLDHALECGIGLLEKDLEDKTQKLKEKERGAQSI